MAYRAEIQIGVKGVQDLIRLQKQLDGTAYKIDQINKKSVQNFGGIAQSINNYNKQLEKASLALKKVAAGTTQETNAIKNYVTALGNANAVQTRQNNLIAQEIKLREQAARIRKLPQTVPTTQYPGPIGPGPATTSPERIRLNQQAAQRRAQASAAVSNAQRGAVGAGIIGGAFPLLFGQGLGAAVGGGIGGALGGAAGGELGFGLSLVGTAVGQAVDTLVENIKSLSTSLLIPTEAINALEQAGIKVSRSTKEQVAQLEKAGRAYDAQTVVLEEITKRLGKGSAERLNELGTATDKLDTELGIFTAKIMSETIPAVILLTKVFGGIVELVNRLKLPEAAIQLGVGAVLTGAGIGSPIPMGGVGALATGALGALAPGTEPDRTKELEKQRNAFKERLANQQRDIQNTKVILELEAQRTQGRNLAEKQINAALDSQIAKEGIKAEFAEKARVLREKYSKIAGTEAQRELDKLLEINSAVERQAILQQDIKDKLVQQGLEIAANTEKYDQAIEAVKTQSAVLTRTNAVAQSRLSAEGALNNLYGAQLQRQYEIATSQQQRFIIAVKMFQQQANAARIEYQQALNNNKLLVNKAELEAKVVELKYKQVLAEKEIAIAQAKSRGNTPDQIREIANAYDKGLNLQREAVTEAYNNVRATKEIAENQNIVAQAVMQTKLLQAESQLAQKLVSEEIGVSEQLANDYAARLRAAVQENINVRGSVDSVNTGTQQVVGSIQVGIQRTQILATTMGTVAQQAANAANEIRKAFEAQQRLNAARAAQASAPQGAADGAYWPGGFKAFADGGVVNKPTMGLVGEGGEPEYIIPASKMKAAMERYASGARGSSVIPNSTSSSGSEMQMGGSDMMPEINPQVSVTTGPVMNMNGSNFVNQNDFISGLQAASRAGAELALQVIRSDGGLRRRMGVG